MKSFLFALVLLTPSLVTAQDGPALSGAGALSCGKLLDQSENLYAKSFHMHWAQGFLSGLNLAGATIGKEPVALPDAESIFAYVSNYCRQHPLQSAGIGSVVLYRELRENRDHSSTRPGP